MHRKLLIISVMFVSLALVIHGQTPDSNNSLGLPVFHHLHLNSTNPNAAIDFYTRQFPSTSKITFAGDPALQSPNDVLVLFTKVKTPPPLQPQTAIWHFGWYVADVRKNLELYKKRPDVKLLPLYTSDEGGFVYVNSDTWPGAGGVPGLTKAEIAEAKAKGVQPVGGSGFAYMQGPDGAVVEYPGNMPERFNHVHMYWEDPFCKQIWYQKHLNALPDRPRPQYTEANCKLPRGADKTWPALEKEGMYRTPAATVVFGDVSINSYIRQGEVPLASTRGHVADHFALGVKNLAAWMAQPGGAAPRVGDPPRTFPSGRVILTKIPPGSPFLNGRAVNLILSPDLTVVDFQPARTRYDGGFISRFQISVPPFGFVTSTSSHE